MRPNRIQLEGFASYRRPVVVDFAAIEFFSLAGATGSGKSSLVDAMIFALYGRIPKLGARAVAPVISAGAERARVAFDFEVGGTDYTAVRAAHRTKGGGATVKEARLQIGDKVLADGASDVSDAVEELLRLRFDDFTRTVVLPQGEFARFLTADKADRQALLRNLLGLDVYIAVRALARTRQAIAKDRTEVAEARIGALEIPDLEEIASVDDRLELLEALSESIIDQEKLLTELEASSLTAAQKVDDLHGQLDRLAGLAQPERLDELDSLAAEAREKVSHGREQVEKVTADLADLEAKIADLPSPDALTSMMDAHDRLADLVERRDGLDLDQAHQRAEASDAALVQAEQRVARARQLLESEKMSHAAHSLSMTLSVGDTCPVCEQEVSSLPERESPAALSELEEEVTAAVSAREAAKVEAAGHQKDLAALETTNSELTAQIKELGSTLADAPAPDELAATFETLQGLADRRSTVKGRLDEQKAQARLAESELDDLSEALRSVGKDLMAARQIVADLEPPLPASDDAIVQWKEFLVWRDQKTAEVRTQIDLAVEAAKQAKAEVAELRSAIVAELEAAQVPVAEPYAVSVTRELQVAKSFKVEAAKLISEKEELELQVEASTTEAAIAGALANHLKADGFERWLMAGAIADLVVGANDRLEQLSSGGYSLDSDESGAFSIIDHHNANEVRSVATLSGGETFLVSLALALSLAETLAARGGADLDTIIIDEGFGTLDDESLETVASVLEDLAGGLMVGVITHVKELAARAPVRFEVTRSPGGSIVERVS